MEVIKYSINIIVTKNCVPNFFAQFCLKVFYIVLVNVSYNSKFIWLFLHTYTF